MSTYQVTVYGEQESSSTTVYAASYETFGNDPGSERTLLQFSDNRDELVAEFSISVRHSYSVYLVQK